MSCLIPLHLMPFVKSPTGYGGISSASISVTSKILTLSRSTQWALCPTILIAILHFLNMMILLPLSKFYMDRNIMLSPIFSLRHLNLWTRRNSSLSLGISLTRSGPNTWVRKRPKRMIIRYNQVTLSSWNRWSDHWKTNLTTMERFTKSSVVSMRRLR